MAYYLSEKNHKRIKPYIESLEKKQTVMFRPANIKPDELIYLLRQAVNTIYPHLKSLYTFRNRRVAGVVECVYIPEEIEDIQSEIVVKMKEITEQCDYWIISEYITLNPAPVKFFYPQLSSLEQEELKAYCESLGRKFTLNLNGSIEIL